MSNKLINFGVIGTGHIGKRHAEMIVRNNESNLVSLCDVKPKAELGLENYKANFYQTHIEMLQTHPELDVVCICTPNGLHSDIAIDVINSGKHVVIEKPIGLSKAKCEQVIYCDGTFDLLHTGHLSLFNKAKSLNCKKLIITVRTQCEDTLHKIQKIDSKLELLEEEKIKFKDDFKSLKLLYIFSKNDTKDEK